MFVLRSDAEDYMKIRIKYNAVVEKGLINYMILVISFNNYLFYTISDI